MVILDHANGSFLPVLADRMADSLPADLKLVRIVLCDRDMKGHFARFAGLAEVIDQFKESSQDRRSIPIITIGLFPTAEVAKSIPKELFAIWQWPGMVYLPYGFTREELISAARRASFGAEVPLSEGLPLTTKNILRTSSEVRHWLENRRRNTEGTLRDFKCAASGDVQLHPAHLIPIAAISEAHRLTLSRLWRQESFVERVAPGSVAIASTKAAMASFEASWHEFESWRAKLGAGDEPKSMVLYSAIGQLEQVCASLTAAIDATQTLSDEMTRGQGAHGNQSAT